MMSILPRHSTPTTHAQSPLPGYTYDSRSARYRNTSTGKFTSRTDILGLLDAQTGALEKQVGELTNAVMEGRIAASVWQEQMRSEVKRQVLSQAALGSGGWDRISQSAYGRAGADLRQLYAKISGTASDIADGTVSLAQAMARANEYAGHGRSHFYEAEREKVKPSASNMMLIERRRLGGGGKTCQDCINFYDQGWQPMGMLPAPGDDSVCQGNCKCVMIRKEIEAAEATQWLGTKK